MIPDFQSIMLPLLQSFQEGKTYTSKDLREMMIKHFKITEQEQTQKTPNGKQLLYYNRIAWAISYLKMAELIEAPERGKYLLAKLGKNTLNAPPERISVKFLKSLPNFNENRNPTRVNVPDDDKTGDKTPDELIETGYVQIVSELSSQLLEQIKTSSAFFFEHLVLDLLLQMGYGGNDFDGEVTPRGGDEGIDGIIKEDKLGLEKIYIQAKKWNDSVQRPEIQKFVGALHGKRAKKGIFITTSDFTKGAIEYSKNLDVTIILIDGKKLTELMIENDVGVTVKHIYKLRKIDRDYFEEQ